MSILLGRLFRKMVGAVDLPAQRRIQSDGADIVCLPGRYSMIYLIFSEKQVAVIDVGSHADISTISAALPEYGFSMAQVSLITITHMHFDHIIGLDAFARKINKPLTFSQIVFDYCEGTRTPQFPQLTLITIIGILAGWGLEGFPIPTKLDMKNGFQFGFPGSKNEFTAQRELLPEAGVELPGFPGWTILDTPGHTEDSVSFYHQAAKILIAGDSVLNFRGGEWNYLLSHPTLYETTKQTIRKLSARQILPGHGPVIELNGTITDLKKPALFIP